METYTQLYFNGAWQEPGSERQFEVLGARSEEPVARFPCATLEDVDLAVYAAMEAFSEWSRLPATERASYMARLYQGLVERSEAFAKTIAIEVGMPLVDSRRYQVDLALEAASFYTKADHCALPMEQNGSTLLVHEPIGIVAAITPWNFPLHQALAKVMPALAAGCTLILKPSPEAPSVAFILAQVIDQVGLPAGVFNLLLDDGTRVGEALVNHSGVDMLSFSGSTDAGKRVSKVASRSLKRVSLQLSGKSPAILLDDADFETAIAGTVGRGLLNSGQTCIAHTRILVPESRYAEAEAIARREIEAIPLVDPLSEAHGLGPLCSGKQRAQVQYYIRRGIEEGAELLAGGPESDPLQGGYYVKPTLFGRVSNDMCIAQEEIFGPVLCLIPYQEVQEAIALANDSIYGLSAAVWSKDLNRAREVALQLLVGQVHINDAELDMTAPFGGYKQSGHGRELGRAGLEAYLESKALLF